jgi:hypothetical protein
MADQRFRCALRDGFRFALPILRLRFLARATSQSFRHHHFTTLAVHSAHRLSVFVSDVMHPRLTAYAVFSTPLLLRGTFRFARNENALEILDLVA